jgi:hypothetical protein
MKCIWPESVKENKYIPGIEASCLGFSGGEGSKLFSQRIGSLTKILEPSSMGKRTDRPLHLGWFYRKTRCIKCPLKEKFLCQKAKQKKKKPD